MNLRVKLRLIGLALAIGLMGVVIAYMTVKSQRQATELRARLGQVDSESFRIADQFRDFLRQLNTSLYRYGDQHRPVDLDTFLKASHNLDLWIDAQKPRLTTAREKAVMQQIDRAYDKYLLAAREVQAKLQSLAPRSATIGDYTGLMNESQHLFTLGEALAKAHYESRESILGHANETLNDLRDLVLASLGCLFVFGVALAWVVYRGMIAPLRVKLVESQALVERQEKLASLGIVAAGVAHEIRNPLTAIKAALFMQRKYFRPGTPEAIDANVVEREILRLEKIVNDFLLFARPADPELASIPVEAPLREVHDLFAGQLALENIQLVLETPPPLCVRCDPAQIKQVLINLVQNAADAIGRDGLVQLRARADRKRLGHTDTNVVVLEVSDTGKGIPPEVQQRLFDPFFTTKETGTGLGLSIAARIVQKQGGVLQYQTQPGHGTTFGIILPQA